MITTEVLQREIDRITTWNPDERNDEVNWGLYYKKEHDYEGLTVRNRINYDLKCWLTKIYRKKIKWERKTSTFHRYWTSLNQWSVCILWFKLSKKKTTTTTTENVQQSKTSITSCMHSLTTDSRAAQWPSSNECILSREWTQLLQGVLVPCHQLLCPTTITSETRDVVSNTRSWPNSSFSAATLGISQPATQPASHTM